MTRSTPPSHSPLVEPSPARGRLAGMAPFRWLVVAILVYFAVAFSLSWLRAIELQTTTWDLGLYQQALWTTAHGRALYETADVETGGFGSLLDVHTAFVLYLLAPLYGLLPYQATMLAVQAAVVAAAAVPLYFLARDLTGSGRLGLAAGLVYLAWTPTLSANLYDFHPEAFLPLEIFALVLFWNRGRYALGFGVAAISFATIELAPVIVFFVGVFALVPPGLSRRSVRERFSRLLGGPMGTVRAWLRRPGVAASLALVVVSAAAYGFLYLLRIDVFPSLFGTTPLPAAASGYLIGVTPSQLGLAFGNLPAYFGAKVTYWLVLVGLLAFVPLLAPRALLLSAPWFAFTLFSSNVNYVTLGFQYGLVAGSTLLVAFAFGLPRAQRVVGAWWTRAAATTTDRTPAGPPSPIVARRRRSAALLAFVVLLGVNLVLSPVNPAMQDAGLGAGYRVSYAPVPGALDVQRLTALVPAGATVLTTDDLFPLVANDPNAYSFLWMPDPGLYLPFTFADPPAYVLIAQDRTPAVLSWIVGALYDRPYYGVRGVAWNSPAGTVLLFEHGYTGPPAEFGAAPVGSGVYYGYPICSESAGFSTTDPGSTFPTVDESVPGAEGTVWYGPDVTLAPGNYTVGLSLRVAPLPGFPVPNGTAPVVWVGAFAFAQPSYYGWTFPYATLASTGFSSVTFNVSLASPTIEFEVQGQLLDSAVQVTLNYLSIAPESSP
jgi:uncharacterized membrane protein